MINVALKKFLITVGSAAVLAGACAASASAATIPSLSAGEFANIGAEVVGSFPLIGASYSEGATQYPGAVAFGAIGNSAYFDYTFNLTGPATVVTSIGAIGNAITLGTATPLASTAVLTPVSTISIPATSTFALYEDEGGTAVLKSPSLPPSGNTLTYAGLGSGEYFVVAVGTLTHAGFSLLSGSIQVSSVPVPGALLLFGSGLAALTVVGVRRRSDAKV